MQEHEAPSGSPSVRHHEHVPGSRVEAAAAGPAVTRALPARAALCLLSVAAFACVCALLRPLVPWPEDFGLRAKFEYFRAHKDEFDLLLVGSSRVFRSFDPEILDAELLCRGLPLRSFNLGVGGMGAFEMDHTLKAALALRPARLRYALVEGGPWVHDEYFLGDPLSQRIVFWHSVEETQLAVRSVWLGDGSFGDKLMQSCTHVELCARRLVNLTQGPRVVAAWLGTGRDPYDRTLTREELEHGRGHQALEEIAARLPSLSRDRLLRDPARFAARVARIPEENAREVPLQHYNLAALRAQQRAAQAAGVTLMLVAPPGSAGEPERSALQRAGLVSSLLDLNRPEQYPELFRIDHRWDEQHLNRAGAEAASRILASLFADRVAEMARDR